MLLYCITQNVISQDNLDSTFKKNYTTLEEALRVPEAVFKLTIINQELKIKPSDWAKFINLEELDLSGDHLKKIPEEISLLPNLKILNLSNNDFRELPANFNKLLKLEELYLNNDKNLRLEKTLLLLGKLPNLKSLHLEQDNLKSLPENIKDLTKLEKLYLNNNKFKKVPLQIRGLQHLQYLDMKDNELKPQINSNNVPENLNFGIRIIF